MNKKTKDLYIIDAISFLDLFAIGLTFPLLAGRLRELEASHFTIGLYSSLYSGLQVLSGPVIGSWSDVRDRKSVMIYTVILSSLGYMLLGTANTLISILIARIILGITKHTQTICRAMIADILPPTERAGAFGRSAGLGSIGFILGPLLGGHISEFHSGFYYVCIITSIIFMLNLVLAQQLSHNFKTTKKNRKESNLSFSQKVLNEFSNSITELTDLNWHALWFSFLIRFIFGFSTHIFFSQQSVYLREEFQMSQKSMGYIMSFFSTVGSLSAFSLQHINNHFYKNDTSYHQRLMHFFGLMTISLFALFLVPTIELTVIILVPFAISCAVLRIITMELMLKRSEGSHKGSLSGSSNSIMSVARFLTPITSGIITDQFGIRASLLFATIPSVGALVLCSYRKR